MTYLEIARMAGYSITRCTSLDMEPKESWEFKGTDGCTFFGYKSEDAAAKAAVEYQFADTSEELSTLVIKLLRKHKSKPKRKQSESNRNNTDRSGGNLPPARN